MRLGAGAVVLVGLSVARPVSSDGVRPPSAAKLRTPTITAHAREPKAPPRRAPAIPAAVADPDADAFVDALEAALDSCAVDGDLVAISCEATPCFAAIRGDGSAFLAIVDDCPAWSDVYGPIARLTWETADCGGGAEGVLFLSAWQDGDPAEPPGLDARRGDLLAAWPCGV
jgi:hypothetical protein